MAVDDCHRGVMWGKNGQDHHPAAPHQAHGERVGAAASHAPGRRCGNRAFVVIWPCSTARTAPPAIWGEGWRAVAVQPPNPAAIGLGDPPDPADWDAIITAPADARVVAGELARLGGVSGVLAGDEVAVPLAEDVAWRLGLPGNDPATSWRRRDKGLMSEALAAAGLSHPATVRANTLDSALGSADAMGWPVVLKPPASCAADGFALCQDAAELAAAWQRTYQQQTVLGDRNDALIVQEYLPGGQYTVNTVTCQGRHLVTDAWAERRLLLPGGGMACDRSDLISPAHPIYAQLVAYTRAVLDALEITWGPGHTETRLDAGGQPQLIDCAARLPGYYPQPLLTEMLGLSQLGAAVLAATDSAALAAQRRNPLAPQGGLTQLWLIVPDDGVGLDGGVLDQMAALPGVREPFGHLTAGLARRTTDLISAVGGFNLAGPAEVVEAAARTIRQLETRLYRHRFELTPL
jgi:Carbamoyl-phosphate synthase L chain, ATP binding domain